MNLKNLLQNADPVRQEPHIDARRIRTHVVAAAHHVDVRPAVSARRATVVAGIALITAAMLVGMQMLSHAAVRFEVRLAEDQPAAGLTAVRLAHSTRTIYLHPEVVVTNADIAFSNVIPGSTPAEQFWIDVRLNAAGADKMRRATMAHLGRPIAILVDGEVVMVPSVKSPIGGAAVISGDYTRAEAERIAQGMNPYR